MCAIFLPFHLDTCGRVYLANTECQPEYVRRNQTPHLCVSWVHKKSDLRPIEVACVAYLHSQRSRGDVPRCCVHHLLPYTYRAIRAFASLVVHTVRCNNIPSTGADGSSVRRGKVRQGLAGGARESGPPANGARQAAGRRVQLQAQRG